MPTFKMFYMNKKNHCIHMIYYSSMGKINHFGIHFHLQTQELVKQNGKNDRSNYDYIETIAWEHFLKYSKTSASSATTTTIKKKEQFWI